jgi:hypothetical protein
MLRMGSAEEYGWKMGESGVDRKTLSWFTRQTWRMDFVINRRTEWKYTEGEKRESLPRAKL